MAARLSSARPVAIVSGLGSPVDLGDLADMLSVIADGAIIVAKVVKDKEALPRQILLYRDFIRAIFLGT